MLKELHIRNFALIDKLDIDFESGFSVITGETGAGKSIVLGAIGLLMGQRADTKAIKTDAQKCSIEANFNLSAYDMKEWFDENPEERKRLGWIKHWEYENMKEIKEDLPDYDPVRHYLLKSEVTVDQYTTKDKYVIIEKTEEMLELEEKLEIMNLYVPTGTMIVDSQGGALL